MRQSPSASFSVRRLSLIRGRGKTRAGRLETVDQWLVCSNLLSSLDSPVVFDIGLGDTPDTTVELFHSIRARYPLVRMYGIDHHAGRVAFAQQHQEQGLSFHLGGFDAGEEFGRAHVIRVFNVLRGYPLPDIAKAHYALGNSLVEGGWLLDGNASADGHVAVALLMQRDGRYLRRRSLLFKVSGSKGFSPVMLRNFLPRDLRGTARHGHPMESFFDRWISAWESVRHAVATPFQSSVEALSETLNIAIKYPGVAIWHPTGGIPQRDGTFQSLVLDP